MRTYRLRNLLCGAVALGCFICLLHFYGTKYFYGNALRWRVMTKERQQVLIILTQTRSGSSFAGELFAATNNSLYLYEPLYPYSLKCDLFNPEKEALLKQLLNCDFFNLDSIYAQGFLKSNWTDGARCIERGICFAQQSTSLLSKYREMCANGSRDFEPESETCGYPLRPENLSTVCKSAEILITKITRIRTLRDLESIYRHLKAVGKDIFVVHLLRDIRAIVSSRLKLIKDTNRIANITKGALEITCHRQRSNLKYVSAAYRDASIISDKRYVRVRYEDLASDAVGQAKRIFNFLGRSLPPEVVRHIRDFLHPSKSVLKAIKRGLRNRKDQLSKQYTNPFGVVRDPTQVLNEWRTSIPFEYVRRMQEGCGDVMKELGYTIFRNEKELKNTSLPSVSAPHE